MYEIGPTVPFELSTRGEHLTKYPFAKLEVGQSFFVPNLAMNPPPELIEQASTLRNMQTHCNIRNKRKKFEGRIFKASVNPENPNYIQVARIK